MFQMNWGEIREIVGDVECFPDFFRGLSFDHVCNSLASGVKEGFDIQIIRSLKRVSKIHRKGIFTRIISNNIS
jgi:hypothetical protein